MNQRALLLAVLLPGAVDRLSGQVPAAVLDSVAQRVIAREHVVGASVLVARRGTVILH